MNSATLRNDYTTVEQLIKELQKYPMDKLVMIRVMDSLEPLVIGEEEVFYIRAIDTYIMDTLYRDDSEQVNILVIE